MTVQLDETFLNDLGLAGASDEQKQAFVQRVLETLELRVGTRLAQELNDEQLAEFEKIAPVEGDSPEAIAGKQEQMVEWLKANRPDYDSVIAEELGKLKHELSSSLGAVFDKSA